MNNKDVQQLLYIFPNLLDKHEKIVNCAVVTHVKEDLDIS